MEELNAGSDLTGVVLLGGLKYDWDFPFVLSECSDAGEVLRDQILAQRHGRKKIIEHDTSPRTEIVLCQLQNYPPAMPNFCGVVGFP